VHNSVLYIYASSTYINQHAMDVQVVVDWDTGLVHVGIYDKSLCFRLLYD
jgi:hypothetical protein